MKPAELAEIGSGVASLLEAFSWTPRRVYLDPLITQGSVLFELWFDRQLRYILRRGLPKLKQSKTLRLREAAEEVPDMVAIELVVDAYETFKDRATERAFNRLMRAALEHGANQAIRDIGAIMSFDMKNETAVQWLKDHGAERLGKDINKTTRKRVRSLLIKGLQDGKNYQQIAKDLRDLYAGFRNTSPLRHIRNRAELIAVTELGDAFTEGTYQAAELLQSRGYVLEKTWLTSPGACEICAPNNAAGWIAFDRPFPSGDFRPLGHPGCRCALLTRSVFK